MAAGYTRTGKSVFFEKFVLTVRFTMKFLSALLLEIFRPLLCSIAGIRRAILFKKLERQTHTKADLE